MLTLGPIAFAAPAVLVALAVLPVVWWLLRITPPQPRTLRFPAAWLLRDLMAQEETPARTPLWLLLLRLAVAGLAIVALAGPLLNPHQRLPGTGPLILVVDDGWAAARDWPERQALLGSLITRAERQERTVIVLTTAPQAGPGTAEPRPLAAGPLPAAEARRLIQGLAPHPWPADRAAALAAFKALGLAGGAAWSVWLCDGLDSPEAEALARHLQRLGGLELLAPAAQALPHLLLPPVPEGDQLTASVVRAAAGPEQALAVRLSAGDGRLLGLEQARFASGSNTAEVRFTLPVELRNQAARLSLEGEASAGSTVLLDERWQKRIVGLVSVREGNEIQPLLSDLYYLDRALAPFSAVRRGTLGELLAHALSVLLLADVGALAADELAALEGWVGRGGVLVRFAGPRLAAAPDRLLPVRLRGGDRALGGVLSWAQPARLAPFDPHGPFAGLTAPAEVTVERQVLAEPTLDVTDRTWARLVDGTPLVTAARRGQGQVVLIHTTANPDWSNLALSGLFVEMLRRLTAQGVGVNGTGAQGPALLQPLEILDARGRLGEPGPEIVPLAAAELAAQRVEARHPPGFYGTPDSKRALNLTAATRTLRPFERLPQGVVRGTLTRPGEIELKPALLTTAAVLLLLDFALALWLRRTDRRLARRTAGLVLAGALLMAGPARADDAAALRAAGRTWLGYVLTGDPAADQVSREGLEGLAQVLVRRTAVDAAGALGVDPERDELVFFPLLYWPVGAAQRPLSPRARQRVNLYLRQGGTILFDTRDGGLAGAAALAGLGEGVEFPPLAPLPPDHVLTKAFYLMQDFPGRITGGPLWVEAREDRRLDGVSSVIIGGADWAGAWAVDGSGRALYAAVPGGERQRELAYRFGINLVMYALTGNYKADQVHVPAILERMQ